MGAAGNERSSRGLAFACMAAMAVATATAWTACGGDTADTSGGFGGGAGKTDGGAAGKGGGGSGAGGVAGTGASAGDASGWPDGPGADGAGGAGGNTDGGPADGAAGAAGACGGLATAFATVGPVCAPCMEKSCCAEATACGATPDCAALIDCVVKCPPGDSTCSSGCVSKYPGGVAAGTKLADCAGKSCPWVCETCGGLGSHLSLGATCNQCAQQNCCASGKACGTNPDCVSLIQCVLGCTPGDTACQNACSAKYPNGGPVASGVASCLDTNCKSSACSQCGGLGVTVPTLGSACKTCIDQKCCALGSKCANNGDCVTLLQCAIACAPNDKPCIDACTQKTPGGVADLSGLAGCLQGAGCTCP